MTAPPAEKVKAACEALAVQDPILAKAYQAIGVPAWRDAPATYGTLARAVTFQLISTTAAEAIWQRLLQRFGDPVSADSILAASEADLRSCGQSGPKIAHLKSIAEACVSGKLDFDRLEALDSPAAALELISVRGIGPWTANLFLLTALGRLDVFPHGDVGIMEAHRRLSATENRHDTKTFEPLVRNWFPYQGVAAHLLWAWLHFDRSV
ncbi:MAG: DNA-3-methyladenine glycosylase 2 family protein [Pseudomonadota bacterium]